MVNLFIGFTAVCKKAFLGFLGPPQAGLNDFRKSGRFLELRFQRGEEKINGDNVEGRSLDLTYSAMMGCLQKRQLPIIPRLIKIFLVKNDQKSVIFGRFLIENSGPLWDGGCFLRRRGDF